MPRSPVGKNKKKQTISSYFMLLFFVSVIVIPFLLKPERADAQMVDPTGWPRTIFTEIKQAYRWVKDNIYNKLQGTLKEAAAVAFKNSMKVFFGRLAEDTAVWLASAGTGQKPLFLSDPGQYFKDVGDAALGDALYTLGANTFGVNVCEPDLSAKISITFALGKTFNPSTWCQDSCRSTNSTQSKAVSAKYIMTSDMTEEQKERTIDYFKAFDSEAGIENFKDLKPGSFICPVTCPTGIGRMGFIPNCSNPAYADEGGTPLNTERVNLQACITTMQFLYDSELQKSQTDLNLCLRNCTKGARKAQCTASTVLKNVKNLKDQKIIGTQVGLYFQPEQNDLGQLLTLYGVLQEKKQSEIDAERLLYQNQIGPVTSKVTREVLTPSELVQARGTVSLQQATATEEVYTGSIKADVVTIFTNTLINKLIQRFYGGKCALNPSAEACKGPSGGSKLSQLIFGGGGPSGIAAAKLQFASIAKLNFTRGSPGQDPIAINDLVAKGIVDSGFQTAIDQMLTVKEAIDKGLVGGTFGFDVEGREPNLDSGVPYQTIVYLRKYRVVPVGWELAAEWIRDHPQNITLEKLVSEEFSRCDSDKHFCSNNNTRSCQADSDCYDENIYPACTGNSQCPGQICLSATEGAKSVCYDSCDPDVPPEDLPCGDGRECRTTATGTGYCVRTDEPFCQPESGVSPFCGLVDPNWVLKMPETYCEKRGASDTILAKDFICDEDTNGDEKVDCNNGDIGHWQISRDSETCVDEVACLKEDSQGKCQAYGYCFEEKPIWRFNGDECSRVYASCQSYTAADGSTVSYLKNTLDTNGCDATNAGCRWYCAEPAYDTATGQWSCTRDNASNKIRFDRDVAECDETEVGCQEYITTGESSGANIFANSSFEYYTVQIDDGVPDLYSDYTPGYPSVWVGNQNILSPCGAAAEAVSDAYTGGAALKLTWRDTCSATDSGHYMVLNDINTGHSVLNRTFTFSFYAKADAATVLTVNASQGRGGEVFRYPVKDFNLTTEWQRFSFTEIFNTLYLEGGVPKYPNLVVVAFRPVEGRVLYFDGMQVEEGGLSNYKDYGSENKIYLNKNRLACEAKDVGCDKYTPVKGGLSVPGVVYGQNMCSADKVGCQSFRETAIDNIPKRSGQDPVYFISGTGTSCPNTAVGCEEYTNLDEVARGGEGKEYFQQIRQCIKPNTPSIPIANYYTWEGSDTAGYQLRAFRYLVSNLNNYNGESGNAPCTNLSIEAGGTTPSCVDVNTLDETESLRPAFCTADDLASNPDCTEFYDTAGHIFYRLRSRIIVETDKCYSYRNTTDAQEDPASNKIYFINADTSVRCAASQAGCREYKGNTGEVTRDIFKDDFEKVETGAVNWVTGNVSNESLRANEHSLHVTGNTTATSTNVPNVLKEGKMANGQYYKISFWLKPDTATTINSVFIQDNLPSGPAGRLDFPGLAVPLAVTSDWNKYTFGPLLFDRSPASPGDYEQLVISLNGAYYLDNVSLEEVNDTVYLIKNTYLSCQAADLGCQEYKNSRGISKFIKSFDHLCAEKFIGCQAMINTRNSTNPYQTTVKGIVTPADTFETYVNNSANYCSASAKGCQRFGLPALDSTNQPTAWQTKYLINDPDKYQYIDSEGNDKSIACVASEEGCDEFNYSNGTGVSWFKDPQGKTCEYKQTPDSTEYRWYKKNTNLLCPYVTPPLETQPSGKACVMTCAAGIYAGQACVLNSDCPNSYCNGDATDVGKACTSDANCKPGNRCDYWAGLCPEAQSGCNEYRDPSDPENCRSQCPLEEIGGEPVPMDENCKYTVCVGGTKNGESCYSSGDCLGGGTCVASGVSAIGLPGCHSYYYIKDSVEANQEECGNTVNVEEGCLPFNDTSNPVLNMRGQ
ncbi:MAG: hypothetical protein WC528_00980 [Patescibacteria group bacterium]